jgi:hypothetical protein
LELLAAQKLGEEIDERELNTFMISNAGEVEGYAKSLCIEMMGNILSQSE